MSNLALVSNTVDVPGSILDLERRLIAEFKLLEQARGLMRASMQRDAGIRCEYLVVKDDAEQKLVEAVIGATAAAAEAALSRPGMPVKCDVSDWRRREFEKKVEEFRRRHSYEEWSGRVNALYANFRPTALWAYIVQAYSPERLLEEARERAAEKLITALDLFRQKEVKRVSGRVEIDVYMYSEPDFHNPKLRSYTWNAVSQFKELAEAMEVLIATSGLDTDRYELVEMAQKLEQLDRHGFKFTSRDRYDFDGALTFVCFSSAIKVYLPEPIAAALNMFVSQYGQKVLARYGNRR